MVPYKLHSDGDVIVAELTSLGLYEGPDLEAIAGGLQEELMRSRTVQMVLDCSRLRFMASRALSVILTLSTMARQHQGGFIVCGLSPQLARLFHLAALGRLVTTAGTRQEALAIIAGAGSGQACSPPA